MIQSVIRCSRSSRHLQILISNYRFIFVHSFILDSSIFRIEYEATTCKDYYLVPGYPETFIPAGKSVTIFGQLRNKRWRCVIENCDHLNNNTEKSSKEFPNVLLCENADIEKPCDMIQDDKQYVCYYPLIGSIPSSIITELNDEPNDETTSEAEESNSDTETEDNNTNKEHMNSSLCKCGRHLPPSRNSRLQSCSFCQYCTMRSPVKTITAREHLKYVNFQRFPSVSSVPLPTLPESPTESTIAELNMALESLAKITPRSRPVSGRSDCNRNSWTARF